MAVEHVQEDETNLLKLSGAADIYDAEQLREILLHFLESHSSIVLDLSGLESCDITSIQLLYAASKSALNTGRPFSIRALSPAFTEACERLGINIEQLSSN